ncbi:TSUP family transporter [Marinobacterium rhizophilum]|uniref:Probable membrane transporter protein n=1 Tax=Marinobacterium rhizophilum TaxID=420402 RepID=A0ABY5HHJ7_9GAMM|nr:TSUP family transporter [Marinobacterium rhizophilum]UTW11321.1 TSUP family transporter [Marinobacterium rhizophilum]
MTDLLGWQYALIGLIFVWSGFVRSGLGFGGAVLSLPFLLLILDEPLVFLPLIAVHLLVFSSLIAWQGYRRNRREPAAAGGGNIDWVYLKSSLKVMIIPKLVGVFGLLTLPGDIMTSIIFAIVIVYAVGYVLDRPFRSNNPYVDKLFLILGGYVSGTSLIGAPLIVAVYGTHVARHQLRDTLFVLWFILVVIKMTSFLIAGVDLQLIHHLWLLPCAFVGHLIGERFHRTLLKSETPLFFRVLGGVLILVSLMGMARTFGLL